jgi:hypothetical protein
VTFEGLHISMLLLLMEVVKTDYVLDVKPQYELLF